MLTPYLDRELVERLLPFPKLISALEEMYHSHVMVPERQLYHIGKSQFEFSHNQLLIMPAWSLQGSEDFGVKILTSFPGNPKIGLMVKNGVYQLFDGKTGLLKACVDGASLTQRRTAAVSALATQHLARFDARILVVVGTGALAPYLVRSHCERYSSTISKVFLWGRDTKKAKAVVNDLKCSGFNGNLEVASDLEGAVRGAHVVVSATSASEPIIKGEWIEPGTHIDLLGSYQKQMREVDDELFKRAQAVFIDNPDACNTAGEIVTALEHSSLKRDEIHTYGELLKSAALGRKMLTDITVSKSIGTAEMDLAAAILAYDELRDEQNRFP